MENELHFLFKIRSLKINEIREHRIGNAQSFSTHIPGNDNSRRWLANKIMARYLEDARTVDTTNDTKNKSNKTLKYRDLL